MTLDSSERLTNAFIERAVAGKFFKILLSSVNERKTERVCDRDVFAIVGGTGLFRAVFQYQYAVMTRNCSLG